MFELATLMEQFPYLGIFVLLVLGDLGLPFPEDTTLILSGFLIAQDVIKLLPTLLVVYGTLLLTDFSLYFFGKKYGRRVVEHRKFRKIISPERLSNLEEKFRKWGIFVVFVGRHFLGIRAQVFLAAGVMRMSALKFLIADGTSAILSMALMVGIGYFGGSSIRILKEDMIRVEYIVIAVFVIVLGGWLIFRFLKTKKT